jgi:hypothetical protein
VLQPNTPPISESIALLASLLAINLSALLSVSAALVPFIMSSARPLAMSAVRARLGIGYLGVSMVSGCSDDLLAPSTPFCSRPASRSGGAHFYGHTSQPSDQFTVAAIHKFLVCFRIAY